MSRWKGDRAATGEHCQPELRDRGLDWGPRGCAKDRDGVRNLEFWDRHDLRRYSQRGCVRGRECSDTLLRFRGLNGPSSTRVPLSLFAVLTATPATDQHPERGLQRRPTPISRALPNAQAGKRRGTRMRCVAFFNVYLSFAARPPWRTNFSRPAHSAHPVRRVEHAFRLLVNSSADSDAAAGRGRSGAAEEINFADPLVPTPLEAALLAEADTGRLQHFLLIEAASSPAAPISLTNWTAIGGNTTAIAPRPRLNARRRIRPAAGPRHCSTSCTAKSCTAATIRRQPS